jgi:hypothetical protein
MLSPAENEDQDVAYEIPEILFKLKDQFNVVDVQWPEYHEDEEEDQVATPNDPNAAQPEGEPGAEPNPGDQQDANSLGLDDQAGAGADDMGDSGAGEDTGSLLQQVISMMTADAEARKADAEARKAEAKQREAKNTVEQAMAQVKQQEQMMDMDAYQKAQREQQKETKQLAQLARWRKMVQNGDDDQDLSTYISDEDEEAVHRSSLRNRVDPKQLAKFIVSRMR